MSQSHALASVPVDAPLPSFPAVASDRACALLRVAEAVLPHLQAGRAVDAAILRSAMVAAFGASDAEGAWGWKDAYEACEAAQLLFLRKFGPAMRASAGSPSALVAMLGKVAALLPSQTCRSEESQALQQFSTPVALAFAVAQAAAIGTGDLVLEPSAGTGLLAAFGEMAGARVVLNELGDSLCRGATTLDFIEERYEHLADQLRHLEWRSDRVRYALSLLYLSFVSFVGTSLTLAVDVLFHNRLVAVPTLLAIAGVVLMMGASVNLVREAHRALLTNRLEVRFYRVLNERRKAAGGCGSGPAPPEAG